MNQKVGLLSLRDLWLYFGRVKMSTLKQQSLSVRWKALIH